MIQIGIFRFEKKDTIFYIGGVAALIGIYQYHLVLGTIALVTSLLAKKMGSPWWSYTFLGSIGVYVIWAIKTFWLGI